MKKVDKIYKRICIRLFNYIFKLAGKLPYDSSYQISKNHLELNSNEKFIVSLTTFPKRINHVWLTIESILRQTSKPDAIFLWLYKGEFPDKDLLPKELLKQEKRGLTIRFCDENLKPHKKYYYTLKEFPRSNIITIDDDIIYHPKLIENFKNTQNLYPRSICASIIQKITFTKSGLNDYRQWPHIKKNTEPSLKYLPIGAGGVLYPPNSLHPEVLNLFILKKIALTADDLWLKIMSARQGTPVVGMSGEYPGRFIPIIIKDNEVLMQNNVHGGHNNKVMRELMDYYDLPHSLFRNNYHPI